MKLFMLLLGCRPTGRFTEQHDIFFGIAENIPSLIPAIIRYWPEAHGKIHIDAWREVNVVDGFSVTVKDREAVTNQETNKLFFVNLGGYKPGEFDEFHYKMLAVAPDTKSAQRKAMATAFYKHISLKKSEFHVKASAHIDDKYGVDVDDVFAIRDILTPAEKKLYQLELASGSKLPEDELHLGYFKLKDFSDAARGTSG